MSKNWSAVDLDIFLRGPETSVFWLVVISNGRKELKEKLCIEEGRTHTSLKQEGIPLI